METATSKPKNTPKSNFPPRRGQVIVRIFKSLFKSEAAAASVAGGSGRKRGENGSCFTSTSTSPAIPSGYNSDAQSDACS